MHFHSMCGGSISDPLGLAVLSQQLRNIRTPTVEHSGHSCCFSRCRVLWPACLSVQELWEALSMQLLAQVTDLGEVDCMISQNIYVYIISPKVCDIASRPCRLAGSADCLPEDLKGGPQSQA